MLDRDLRKDYEIVSKAIHELNNCWCRDEVPSREVGLNLTVEAQLALAHLAVAAKVPRK